VIFGALPLDQAEGAILAHSHRLADRMLRKGAVLDAAALAALCADGRTDIIAAKLEPGDVAENDAAERFAAPFDAPRLKRTRAATGRVNFTAETAGLLRVDAARVDALNAIDPALTIATLPDYAVVAARDMVATVKVIPLAVAGAMLQAAEAIANGGRPPMTLHPFRPLRVGLILTELPGLKESVLEGTVEATTARVAALGGAMLPALRCAHAEVPIAEHLRALIADGADLLLVAGASAVVDRRDVGPAGIVTAGGEIVHFGMPVDPGNLICIGQIGERPALVLPGCARSPRQNGIDWILSRLFAGRPVGPAEVMRLGVGGLLKETEARPLPRAKAAATAEAPTAPRPEPRGSGVAAVVLAAGRSSRMAPYNKLLLADRSGKPMVARVVDNVLASGARPIVVVTGHQWEEVAAALAGKPLRLVHAPDFAEGLSASLRAGIAAVPEEARAALVCLADMPLVTGRVLDRLVAAYDPDEGRAIVVPTYHGKPGNPILWDRRYFGEIMALSGDMGARLLLQQHLEAVADIEVGEDAVLRDFDTVESLATLPARLRPEIVGEPG
jgi:molybdenum cofactor cytidylyltransferase